MGDPLDAFGPTLRRLREQAGLTQERLAERAGLSSTAVRALEAGRRRRPYPHTVRALAAALGLDGEAAAALTAARPPAERPRPAPPAPQTRLIGRQDEVRTVSEELVSGEARLVTLTGPGGVGKSRLAVEIAIEAGSRLADGAVVSWLAPLQDPALVLPTIAQSLDLRDRGARPLPEALREYLRRRRLLLVLDNLEHLLEAAPAVAALLEASPGLRVLATSRSPLQVRGEHVRPVPPLGPRPATDLLVERMAQVGAEDDVDPAVALAICQRLDRLPLAIELAAARTRVLPAERLLTQLDRALDLLVDGYRDLPSRQRTLRATIGWSYDLLGGAEQALLSHVAVFAGGWTLDAAAAVAELDPVLTLDLHDDLLGASLIEREPGDGEPRFGLLETVRAFAREELEAGAAAAACGRHAAHFHGLAREARTGLEGLDELVWLNRLAAEHDNLRVAMRRLLDEGDVDRMSGICCLWKLWVIRGLFTEAERWSSEALALTPPEAIAIRARLGELRALLRFIQGRPEDAYEGAVEVLELARRLDDPHMLTWALIGAGLSSVASGRLERASAPLQEAERLSWEHGLIARAATARTYLAHVAIAGGRTAEADRMLAEITPGPDTPPLWEHGSALNARSLIALVEGNTARAGRLAAQAAGILDRFRDSWVMAHSITCLACAAALEGRSEPAAQLFGASDLLMERTGASLLTAYAPLDTRGRAAAVADLGRERFDALAGEGAGATAEELIETGTAP